MCRYPTVWRNTKRSLIPCEHFRSCITTETTFHSFWNGWFMRKRTCLGILQRGQPSPVLRDFAVVKHKCTWSLSFLFLNIRMQLFPPMSSGYISNWVINCLTGTCACKLENYFSLLVKEMDGQYSAWLHCTVNKNPCVCVCGWVGSSIQLGLPSHQAGQAGHGS